MKHYSRNSISRNPELRQTFLQIIESLETCDTDRLKSLHLLKPRQKYEKQYLEACDSKSEIKPSPRSKQLDYLDVVESSTRPLISHSSTPNLTIYSEDNNNYRRNSFPNRKDLLVNKSDSDLSSIKITVDVPDSDRKFVKTHARARSDTCAIVSNDTCEPGSWSRVVPASTCWTPRPRCNQSLLQFLSESVESGATNRAELDRENAHFVFAETVIFTFEQINCDKYLQDILNTGDDTEQELDEDDEEIKRLQREIKKRRHDKKRKRHLMSLAPGHSDGQSDTAGTTDQSASPGYSDVDTAATDTALDSNDEDFTAAETLTSDPGAECSAECIALSLLSQVGRGRLPPADKLCWLVSRDMVNQELIPLPSSLPVDPDTDTGHVTEIRGSMTWAPPRPQIVLTVQGVPGKRTLALSNQRWMCAGCGMKVEQRYSRSFRWCHYLGKYFCTGCHSNSTNVIPARIIHQWDFKKYPVSNFALEILKSYCKILRPI